MSHTISKSWKYPCKVQWIIEKLRKNENLYQSHRNKHKFWSLNRPPDQLCTKYHYYQTDELWKQHRSAEEKKNWPKLWKHTCLSSMARMSFSEYSLCLVLIGWTCYLKQMALDCLQCHPLHFQQTLHVEPMILWENGPSMTSVMRVFPGLKKKNCSQRLLHIERKGGKRQHMKLESVPLYQWNELLLLQIHKINILIWNVTKRNFKKYCSNNNSTSNDWWISKLWIQKATKKNCFYSFNQ